LRLPASCAIFQVTSVKEVRINPDFYLHNIYLQLVVNTKLLTRFPVTLSPSWYRRLSASTASDNALQLTLKPKRHPTTARLNRGVRTQLCGGRQEPPGKGDLGQRFTARDGEPPSSAPGAEAILHQRREGRNFITLDKGLK
jgi:hypothetical protein